MLLPTACAVAMPPLLTVAMEDTLGVQLTELLKSFLLPSLYVPIALNCCCAPTAILGPVGVTASDTKIPLL